MTKQTFSWNICKMKQFWKQYDIYSHGCPIPVAARSKAWVCDGSLAGIVGSNLTGGTAVSCECCLLFGSGLCRADHSPRGIHTVADTMHNYWCLCDVHQYWERGLRRN